MAREPNLVLRGSIWTLRVSVPKPLRELRAAAGSKANPREIWRSTGESDPRRASLARARLLLAVHEEFDAEVLRLRREAEQLASFLTWQQNYASLPIAPTDLVDGAAFPFAAEEGDVLLRELERSPGASHAARARATMQRLEAEADVVGTNALALLGDDAYLDAAMESVAGRDLLRIKRDCLIRDLESGLRQGEFSLVDWAIEEFERKNRVRVPADSIQYSLLATRLTQGWLHAPEEIVSQAVV